MSIPFGKRKKTPEHNAQCFLGVCRNYIDEAIGNDFNKKAKKKFDKYMERMIEIMEGKCKK